jgi:cytochrome c oxidase subunit II
VRRGTIAVLVAIAAVVALALTAIAIFVGWLPEQASRERERIDFIFWLTTWISIGIFAVVASLIIYSVVKFRARPDDDSDGLPIHGHTGLEIVWTAIPVALVTVIAVTSGVALTRNDRAETDPIEISVTALQFAWIFEYPNGRTASNLHLPVGRSALLRLTSRDVIHSFWVPQFGQKQDAVPGIETRVVVTPTRTGTFPVACAELCGLGHALMRTHAIVMESAEFEEWLADGEEAMEAPAEEAGLSVFENQGCGNCHAFAPANAVGTIGPSLDNLPARAEEAGLELEAFVRESIVEPNARIAPGFEPGIMPETYSELPDDELDALVQYLVRGQPGEDEG